MEISNIGASPAAQPTSISKIGSDFETFLKLLTAQISNQDPLNPIDASDYSTQLATFSGVEQQVLTNDLLTSISARLTGTDLVSLSHWIGKQAEIAHKVSFSGQDVSMRADLPNGASHGVIEILSPSGATLSRLDFAASQTTALWDGTDATGAQVMYGTYGARLIPFDGNTPLPAVPVYAYNTVTEVSIKNGNAMLGFSDNTYVTADTATGLRDHT